MRGLGLVELRGHAFKRMPVTPTVFWPDGEKVVEQEKVEKRFVPRGCGIKALIARRFDPAHRPEPLEGLRDEGLLFFAAVGNLWISSCSFSSTLMIPEVP